MKTVFVTLNFFICVASFAQTTYYTCNAASSTNVTTDPAGGGTCNVLEATWNVAGNTLVVPLGQNFTSFDVSPIKTHLEIYGTANFIDGNFDVEGNVDVYGTLNLDATSAPAGSGDCKITLTEANTNLTVHSGGEITRTGTKKSKITIDDASSSAIIIGTVTISDEFKAENMFIVEGATVNVGKFKIETGGTLISEVYGNVVSSGDVEIKSSTVINGSIVASAAFKTKNAGIYVIGQGSIEANSWTDGNSNTINGIENWDALFSTTAAVDLSTVGFIWNGTTWNATVDGVAATGTFDDGDDWAILVSDDFTSTSNWFAGGASIASGRTLELAFQENLPDFVSVKNDGSLEFVDNIGINDADNFYLTGSGDIKMTRNFTRGQWQQMGWPVKSNADLGNITTGGNGPNGSPPWNFDYSNPAGPTTNIYYWDPSTSGWKVPTSGSSLVASAFDIYIFDAATNTTALTVSNSDFNNNAIAQSYLYNDPGPSTTPPGNGTGWTNTITDGWNLWINPFQAVLSSDDVISSMPTAGGSDFIGSVYVWDGSGYQTRAGGVGGAQFISPNQAFFVRSQGITGSHTIPQSARDLTATSPSYFKTSQEIVLNLAGEGYSVNSYVVENSIASFGFDSEFDAYYVYPAYDAPMFNSVGIDSTSYSINQYPDLTVNPLYFTFYYPENSKSFTISLDKTNAPALNFIVLEDLYTGTFTDLLATDYTFNSTNMANMERFKVHFSSTTVDIEELNKPKLNVWLRGDELQLDQNPKFEGATINIYSLNGKLIANGLYNESIIIAKDGVYLVNVVTVGNQSYNTKLVKLN